jgi:3-oxoacyl-[acyl-carrier protein] reductase
MANVKNPRLAGKVAVVTGSGRGMGRAHALLLAHEGAKVVINDLGGHPIGQGADTTVAQQVVDEIRAAGGEAVANTDNVAQMEGARRLIGTAISSFGRLDILINNAGIHRTNQVEDMPEEDWDAVVAVHLKSTFLTIKFAVPIFKRQRGGVIVNVGSESGLGHAMNTNYSAAKEGIIGLTRSIAREVGRFGIRCNAIRPRANTGMAAVYIERTIRWQPLMEALGRFALGQRGYDQFGEDYRPEQVSPLVVWLCTDAARNVNGRNFYVGGGEVGLFSEPEVVRSITRDGGWDLDSLDGVRGRLIGDLTNDFLLADTIGDKEL